MGCVSVGVCVCFVGLGRMFFYVDVNDVVGNPAIVANVAMIVDENDCKDIDDIVVLGNNDVLFGLVVWLDDSLSTSVLAVDIVVELLYRIWLRKFLLTATRVVHVFRTSGVRTRNTCHKPKKNRNDNSFCV